MRRRWVWSPLCSCTSECTAERVMTRTWKPEADLMLSPAAVWPVRSRRPPHVPGQSLPAPVHPPASTARLVQRLRPRHGECGSGHAGLGQRKLQPRTIFGNFPAQGRHLHCMVSNFFVLGANYGRGLIQVLELRLGVCGKGLRVNGWSSRDGGGAACAHLPAQH